jgi:hypothetical protein
MATETKRDSMEAIISEVQTKLKETQINPHTSIPKRPLGLATLPPFVRDEIYAHVLDTELVNVNQPNVSYTHKIKKNLLHFEASRPPFAVDTALFYVNKQFSKEAISFFYEKNLWVRFEIYSADARHAKTMLEESGLLFSVAAEDKIEKCKDHALELKVEEKGSELKRAVVMFPAQYLPRLINFLDQAGRASKSWAPSHALFLTLLNTYGKDVASVQGDLLEGFRLLTGMGGVTVKGQKVLPGYAHGLQKNMQAANFDAENWLATVSSMFDRAKAAKEKKDYTTAVHHCKSAIIALTYGYLTRAETLHSQPEGFNKSIQRIRHDIELTLGTSLFAPYNSVCGSTSPPLSWITNVGSSAESKAQIAAALLAAETALSHATSLATDSPSPESNPWFQSLPPELIPPSNGSWFTDIEAAQAWFELGKVHLAVGEPLFAAGDLERAERVLSEHEGVGEVFDRAREAIDWSVRPGMGLRSVAAVARRGVGAA